MSFDELKRRIDHIHRLLLPENAAPGCFTFTEAVGREMNTLMARWKGDPDDVCNHVSAYHEHESSL